MSNGGACCLLQVCCPPELVGEALVKEYHHDNAEAAEKSTAHDGVRQFAHWVGMHFDLAPAGSLKAYRDAIVEQAKKNP